MNSLGLTEVLTQSHRCPDFFLEIWVDAQNPVAPQSFVQTRATPHECRRTCRILSSGPRREVHGSGSILTCEFFAKGMLGLNDFSPGFPY